MRRFFQNVGNGVSLYYSQPYYDLRNDPVIDLKFERKRASGQTDILTTFLPSLPMVKSIGFDREERIALIHIAHTKANEIWRLAGEPAKEREADFS